MLGMEAYRSALDGVDDMVGLLDAESAVMLDANEATCRFLGVRRDDLHGRPVGTYCPEPIEEAQARVHRLLAVLGDGLMPFEWVVRDRDQRIVPLRAQAHRVPAVGRNVVAVIARPAEVGGAGLTRIEMDAAVLRTLQEQAHLGRSAMGVLHDIRNLLAIAVGNLDLLTGQVRFKRDEAEAVQVIVDALGEIGHLSGRAMRLGRGVEEERRLTDVSTAAVEALSVCRHLVPRGTYLALDLPPGLPPVFLGPQDVIRVLANLLTNAALAVPAGGRIAVSTGIERRASAGMGANSPDEPPIVRLTVSDNGNGISADIRDRVIEPFFTTRAGQGGAGLGLTIVREIAESLGGCIRLRSAPGRGTAVDVCLPAGMIGQGWEGN
jgi:PAS domain S-box-containing protein